MGSHGRGCGCVLPTLQSEDGGAAESSAVASGAALPGNSQGEWYAARGSGMNLLQMPSKDNGTTGNAAGSANGSGGVLRQIWATEGNLAHAVEPMHASSACDGSSFPMEEVQGRSTPVFRVVLSPQTAFYRSYTEAMLRRYGVLSLESGRVPSMLGREMFRGKVTSYRVHAFDDVVIFVHDVGQCIKLLSPEQQRLIERIGVQEYTFGEAATMLRLSLRSVQRRYTEALDELTGIFLKRRLLERIATDPCQEGDTSVRVVSHSPEAV